MLGTLGMGHLSLKRLNAEGLEARLLYWRTSVMNGGLCKYAPLFMGDQLGKPGVGLSTGNFERWLKGALEVGSLSLYGSEGNLEGGFPLQWTLEDR